MHENHPRRRCRHPTCFFLVPVLVRLVLCVIIGRRGRRPPFDSIGGSLL